MTNNSIAIPVRWRGSTLPVRIGFVASQFPVLSETFVVNQIAGMVQRGHDVTVFAGRPEAPARNHPEVARFDLLARTRYWPDGRSDRWELGRLLAGRLRRPRQSLSVMGRCLLLPSRATMARRALVALDAGPFDALVCHFGNIAVEAERLRRSGALRGKLVAVFHAWELTRLLRRQRPGFYDALFRGADLVLPISNAWRRKLIELGCPADKIAVHHMGVDCRRFRFTERRLTEGEPAELVTIGRLVEKKGVEHAIRAVARLRDRGVAVRYRVAGDGPLRQPLAALVDELGLAEQVTLLGARSSDEVATLLGQAHILVAPSVTAADGDQEGIPVSIMEGMAGGLPVVSTIHTGIPELVDHDVSGLLVPERDERALAEALASLIAQPQRWAELGRAARSTVERDFDVERLNDQLEARLSALL